MIGWLIFDFPSVAEAIETGVWDHAIQCLTSPFGTVWGWIGAYMIIVTSMNMLPSPIDLENAIGLGIFLLVLLVVLVILYFTRSAVLVTVIQAIESAMGWLGFILTFTILLSVPVLLFLKAFTYKT